MDLAPIFSLDGQAICVWVSSMIWNRGEEATHQHWQTVTHTNCNLDVYVYVTLQHLQPVSEEALNHRHHVIFKTSETQWDGLASAFYWTFVKSLQFLHVALAFSLKAAQLPTASPVITNTSFSGFREGLRQKAGSRHLRKSVSHRK